MTEGIFVNWDNAQYTTIRWDFIGNWTWDHWYNAVDLTRAMRATVGDKRRITILFDMSNSGAMPINPLLHVKTAMEMLDTRDIVIMAHASGYVRSLASAFRDLNNELGQRIMMVETIGDARSLIQKLPSS